MCKYCICNLLNDYTPIFLHSSTHTAMSAGTLKEKPMNATSTELIDSNQHSNIHNGMILPKTSKGRARLAASILVMPGLALRIWTPSSSSSLEYSWDSGSNCGNFPFRISTSRASVLSTGISFELGCIAGIGGCAGAVGLDAANFLSASFSCA